MTSLRAGSGEEERNPMTRVTREDLRAHLESGIVSPKDPIFHIFPLQSKAGKRHWASRDHDELLYPSDR